MPHSSDEQVKKKKVRSNSVITNIREEGGKDSWFRRRYSPAAHGRDHR